MNRHLWESRYNMIPGPPERGLQARPRAPHSPPAIRDCLPDRVRLSEVRGLYVTETETIVNVTVTFFSQPASKRPQIAAMLPLPFHGG